MKANEAKALANGTSHAKSRSTKAAADHCFAYSTHVHQISLWPLLFCGTLIWKWRPSGQDTSTKSETFPLFIFLSTDRRPYVDERAEDETNWIWRLRSWGLWSKSWLRTGEETLPDLLLHTSFFGGKLKNCWWQVSQKRFFAFNMIMEASWANLIKNLTHKGRKLNSFLKINLSNKGKKKAFSAKW